MRHSHTKIWGSRGILLWVWLACATGAPAAAPGDDNLLDMGADAAAASPTAPTQSAAALPPAVLPPPPAARPPSVPAGKTPERAPPAELDRIKAVPRKQLYKGHRFELSPLANVSINDPYLWHLGVGGSAIFYPHDSFGLGLSATYLYAHPRSANVAAVREGLTSVLAPFDPPSLLAHLDFYWVPLYGKVSIYRQGISNFDMYLAAGGGFATAFDGRRPAEVSVAVGQHYAIDAFFALRVEVRQHLFVDTQTANGLLRSAVQNYVLFNVGLSLFVPASRQDEPS